MPLHRCDLCGCPLDSMGRVPFCSARCLYWDFFGVPALRRKALRREIALNRYRDAVPDDYAPDAPLPAAGDVIGQEERIAITRALAMLHEKRDLLKDTTP